VIVDVWGGRNSQDYIARFVREMDEALAIARREVDAGYLVNLRADAAFNTDDDWDGRAIN